MDYEKLGAFYLGRRYDMDAGRVTDETVLYDAKDLTTHAVCVGMTGSGKTGLGVSLLEEAALDGIPAIAIDPKGDLGNLMLTFPELRPEDFRAWVDEGEAAAKGRTPDEHARVLAERWRSGLADWDQDGARIARFREAVDISIYTPGSNAGLPLAVLRSFSAPPAAVAEDTDALRERVLSAVSGLLALVGIDADPVRSREHILISTLLEEAWRAGRDLDLADIIREIMEPPFDRVGVFDLETFFPGDKRTDLAMAINNLLASPSFASWREGEALDVGRLLHTPEGKPRLSIVSIAHLSEPERMFFVTLLLNEVVSWMRGQSGTGSLRALLYMDEVFGYFPPTANPPSKRPMLTLLKQARAYGLGCVLATQNPVDLDYKGLSNTGTWFLGRLQTERDKARVIEGLEGASAAAGAGFDKARMERLLAGLDSRVFLVNNVHEDEPVLFHTRWVLSYLRGPLTREQIAQLMAPRRASNAAATVGGRARGTLEAVAAETPPAAPAPSDVAPAQPSVEQPTQDDASPASRPVVAAEVDELFLPAARAVPAGHGMLYRPALLGVATVHYANSPAGVDEWRHTALLAPLVDPLRGSPWGDAALLDGGAPGLDEEPVRSAGFGGLPSRAAEPKSYGQWGKMLKSHVYKEYPLQLLKCRELKLTSAVDESRGDFQVRLRQALHERRDAGVEKMRTRYAPKLARLRDQIASAEQKVEKEREQYEEKKTQTAISIGSTILGALFGRKLGKSDVSKAATAAKGAGRTAREKQDIRRAREKLEALEEKLEALEAEFESEIDELRADAADPARLELDELVVRPRKTDFVVEQVSLVWTPWAVDADGNAQPLA